ncbi:MAG: ribosome assembly RNA-binding protein YhbY [Acidaminobacteraceae bacterium]
MINAKQRSFLKAKANTLKPLTQLGKEGISDKFIAELNRALDSHELIKVSVLESNDMTAKDACIEVCEKTRSEFVQAIGKKFVIYREARDMKREDRIQLPVARKVRK